MTKALFLDRDGVINIDSGYVSKVEDFKFVPGIFDFCFKAQTLGYQIVVITNQSGVARGLYTENDFETLTEWMVNQFKKNSISIAGVFYCPHHPQYIYNGITKCDCRKPKPGLILDAATMLDIHLDESVFVGDKESDMQAAKNASIPVRVLLGELELNKENKMSHTHTAPSLFKIMELFESN